jgi:hypothetical protein
VSAWEWMNLLAHGAEDDLRREVTGDDHQSLVRATAPGDGWQAARSYLAAELLNLVDRRYWHSPAADAVTTAKWPSEHVTGRVTSGLNRRSRTLVQLNAEEPPDRRDGDGGWPTPQWLLRIARINASCPSALAIAEVACPRSGASGRSLESRTSNTWGHL